MGAPADATVITKSAFTSQASTDFAGASGTTTGPGSLSGLTGPWYIERQELNINYIRVPTQVGASCTVSLASGTTENGSIEKTELIFFATARAEARVTTLGFNVSSAQQPQEFTINAASGDINGVTYGTINASTLGPMGTIITSQPFIKRSLYTGASSQPIYNKQVTCSNWTAFYENAMRGSEVVAPGETVMSVPYMYNLKFHKDEGCVPGTMRDGHPYSMTGGLPASWKIFGDYIIPGAYSTTKENGQDIQVFIDNVANRITAQQLHEWPIANETVVGSLVLPAQDTGIPEYDINRHA